MVEFVKEARVVLIAKTDVSEGAIREWLWDEGFGSWARDRTGLPIDAEGLVEFAGRVCYLSFGTGPHNPNLTRVREDRNSYLENACHKSKHGSLLEHVSATFVFSDVSRVFTHELVRHRHLSFSQQSLRYVLLSGRPIRFRLPGERSGVDVEEMKRVVIAQVAEYLRLAEKALDGKISGFAEKKAFTSGIRRMLGMGLCQSIVVSGNLRAWRHFIHLRGGENAEEEIREVAMKVAEILSAEYPTLFGDVRFDDDCVELKHGSY